MRDKEREGKTVIHATTTQISFPTCRSALLADKKQVYGTAGPGVGHTLSVSLKTTHQKVLINKFD